MLTNHHDFGVRIVSNVPNVITPHPHVPHDASETTHEANSVCVQCPFYICISSSMVKCDINAIYEL